MQVCEQLMEYTSGSSSTECVASRRRARRTTRFWQAHLLVEEARQRMLRVRLDVVVDQQR